MEKTIKVLDFPTLHLRSVRHGCQDPADSAASFCCLRVGLPVPKWEQQPLSCRHEHESLLRGQEYQSPMRLRLYLLGMGQALQLGAHLPGGDREHQRFPSGKEQAK